MDRLQLDLSTQKKLLQAQEAREGRGREAFLARLPMEISHYQERNVWHLRRGSGWDVCWWWKFCFFVLGGGGSLN